ncbi:hypothetical protein OG562_42720 [Streptomyces sp. NBC_01275]|nr:hypothetical protein [Streptomyces sp. NBC_01275]MCX4767555.1 hypothetical protein [Streptomyces sp. NBC_01275]
MTAEPVRRTELDVLRGLVVLGLVTRFLFGMRGAPPSVSSR